MSGLARMHVVSVSRELDARGESEILAKLSSLPLAAVISSKDERAASLALRIAAESGRGAEIDQQLSTANLRATFAQLAARHAGRQIAVVVESRLARAALHATLELDGLGRSNIGGREVFIGIVDWRSDPTSDVRPSLVALESDWIPPFDVARQSFPGASAPRG